MPERRIRVSDESVNAYGFWVKTSGGDLSDFLKNPVCLWNHHQSWRGTDDEVLPIGKWKDVKVEGAEIFAIPEFDNADKFAAKIANKYENGFLNAASIGIRIIEWSEDPKLMKAGQTRPTITKWSLREISIVDIPANKNAVCFYDADGNQINLSDSGADQSLEKIGLKLLATQEQTTQPAMEDLKILALALGLSDKATQQNVLDALQTLKEKAQKADALELKVKDLEVKLGEQRKEEVKVLLDAAVSDNRITAALRPAYEKLFDSDFDNAKAILGGLTAPVKLSAFAGAKEDGTAGKFSYQGKTFSQLSKEDPKLLETLKENDLATFKQLYKAEYNKEYKETER